MGPLLLAVLVHEAGHLLAMASFGVRITALEVGPFGARMTTDRVRLRAYMSELAIYLAGPAMGVLSAAVAHLLWGEGARHFVQAGLWLSAFNLLPIESLDGGSLLYGVLSGVWGPVTAARWLRAISYGVLLPLLGLGFWLLLREGHNLSLLITCTYLALTALLK